MSGQLCQLGILVRSQPKLPMRVMSEFMGKQWQGSVLMSLAHITTREHGDVPGRGPARYHLDVQVLGITGPTPQGMQSSGEMAPSLKKQQHVVGEQALNFTQAAGSGGGDVGELALRA